METNNELLKKDGWTLLREENSKEVWGKSNLRIYYDPNTDETGKVWDVCQEGE